MDEPKTAPRLRILVIDDEADNQERIQKRLKETPDWDIETVSAGDAVSAMQALRERLFDVAFLDYRLPDSDGLKVLEQIRQLHPKVAVVMLSSFGSEKTAVEAIRLGAIDYLVRSDFAAVDLTRLLRRAIEMQVLQTENTELRQVNRMKNEFISSVSHELRTPLAVILGYAKTMEDGELGKISPQQGKALGAIRRRGERLLAMLNRLLTFKETSKGRQEIILRPTDLSVLLEETLKNVFPEAQNKKFTLKYDIPKNPVWILADQAPLKEIVLSLLSNAVKFAPEGSLVRVVLEVRDDRECWIQIRDQGRGIPREALPRIFESFFHTDENLTREVSGLGLGLALARQIVELHGGRIWLESEGKDKGTTATVALPLSEPESPEKIVDQPLRFEKKRILVVEDNSDIVEIIRLFIAGFSENLLITTTEQGKEALELLGKNEYDLLVLDLIMPGVSGYDILDRLKKLPERKSMPILILSGHQEAAKQAVANGANDYLLKPFHKEAFLQKILQLLGLERRRSSRWRS